MRSVLISQARELNNPVALSALKLDREVGLVRYHGITGYLKEKDFTARRLLYGRGTTSAEGEEDSAAASPPKTARVAFMITSTQKAELKERLGYEEAHIKKLTPLEATLILEHDVETHDVATVERLVLEHNASLLQQQRQHQEHVEQQQLREQHLNDVEETKVEESTETLLLDTSHPRMPSEYIYTKESETASSSSTDIVWYEVVETDASDGLSSVVALYSSQEEANVCLDIKREFAARRAKENGGDPATTYDVRQR